MKPINENLTIINYSNGTITRLKYIVIHYTANDGDTAWGNTNYFKKEYRGASAHYFVDKNSIWQCVADKNISWHCGGGLQGSGGHSFYGKCKNSNSIGIELCSRKDSKGNYYFEGGTIANAVELVKYLMEKYNIPIERVIRHYDVTGKICPAPLVNDTAWAKFKRLLKGEEIDMEELKKLQEQVNTLTKQIEKLESPMIYNYIDDNTAKIAPDANAALQAAIDKGILKGTGEGLNLTLDMVRIHVWNYRLGLYE